MSDAQPLFCEATMTRWIFACLVLLGGFVFSCGGGGSGSSPGAPKVIFVSDTDPNADDANDGASPATPCRTIAGGISRAVASGKTEVRVANGIYEEQVVLADGISLKGGYSPDSWKIAPGETNTFILLVNPGDGRAVVAQNIRTPTVFKGFQVIAPDVATPGASSYGIWIRDCDENLSVLSNTIEAGNAAAGASGADGANGTNGTDGQAGNAALDIVSAYGVDIHACVNLTHALAGGAGGANSCSGTDVSGGDGGLADCPLYTSGIATDPPNPGESGLSGQGAGGGTGGSAGRDAYHQAFACAGYNTFGAVEGGAGSNGAAGSHGAAPAAPSPADGTLTGAGFWAGALSQNGSAGGSGSGGGGGGSGGGAYMHDSCFAKSYGGDNIGGTGGGGGAGGCAGSGGEAGGSGGGSFGIFVSFSAPPQTLPRILDNTVYTGDGGAGGNGGDGGSGGTGGGGAAGGAGQTSLDNTAYPAFGGGTGGDGGNGGHGSGGGGGTGGPSYGIVLANTGAIDTGTLAQDNSIVPAGSGGAPGQGGQSNGFAGLDGQAGNAEPVFKL
jgi:hypothetical protein